MNNDNGNPTVEESTEHLGCGDGLPDDLAALADAPVELTQDDIVIDRAMTHLLRDLDRPFPDPAVRLAGYASACGAEDEEPFDGNS